jgi:2-dehydro-3-deoxyphosphogluconate aldolase/(4S)-4-hydroxy-2-oxoglutarate aldolase
MAGAGIGLVEVVLRTPASLDIIKAIKQELPELKVGTGKVLDANFLKQALDAGSDFIITPAVSSQLLTVLAKCTVPVLPGVSNTADILLAYEFGYNELKLFPASLSGCAPFLKTMGSVFKGISFCSTGGIKQSNQDEYLALTNVFAVGGTWITDAKWVELGQWSKITAACLTAQGIN